MDFTGNIEGSVALALITIVGGLVTNSVVTFLRSRGENQTARVNAEAETARHNRRIETDLNEHLLAALQQATADRDKAVADREPLLARARALAAHLQRVLTSKGKERDAAEADALEYLAAIDAEDGLSTS